METVIKRIDDYNGLRFYQEVDKEGKVLWTYPSTTTKLGEVYPSGYYLEKYIRDNGEHGRIEFEKAGDQGTEVHLAIESLLGGGAVSSEGMTNKVLKCVQAFIDWYTEVKPEILLTEHIVVNHDDKVAGCADLVCTINGEKYIIDYKTSSSLYPSHKLQLASYWSTFKDPDMKGALLQLGNTTKKHYTFSEVKDLPEQYKTFQHFNKTFDILKPDAKPSGIVYPDLFTLNLKQDEDKAN